MGIPLNHPFIGFDIPLQCSILHSVGWAPPNNSLSLFSVEIFKRTGLNDVKLKNRFQYFQLVSIFFQLSFT